MQYTVRELDPTRPLLSVVALATFLGSACAPTDHLLDPLVSEGGSYFASSTTGSRVSSENGGSPGNGGTSNGPGNGGTSNGPGNGGTSTAAQSSAASDPFDWGSGAYDANGGADISYQGHFTGMSCLSSCHNHAFTLGGTVYQSNGTSTASNVQIGLWVNGSLTTTYSGTQGNFFVSVSGSADWAHVQLALRSASGTKVMPINANTTGSCNSCHDSSNRMTAP